MESLTFRPMTPEDLPNAATVYFDAFGPKGLGEAWTIKRSLNHVTDVYNQDLCFTAVYDEKPVGFIFGSVIQYENGPEFFIDTFIVERTFRGKTIGTQLWNYALQQAKKKHLVAVRLLGTPRLPSFSWYHKQQLKESDSVELYKLL